MILHGLLDFDDDCMVMYATILGVRPSLLPDYTTEIITIGGESFFTKMTLQQVRQRLVDAEREVASTGRMEPVPHGGH